MAYAGADGSVWQYEHELPSTGDPTRMAGLQLARDIESFLFDHNHPGYGKPEFLSWALARFDATAVSSGNMPDAVLYWDPRAASMQPHADLDYNPRANQDFGIRYPAAAFQAEGIDTDAREGGDKERMDEVAKELNIAPNHQAVLDPSLARFTSANAVPVTLKDQREEDPEQYGSDKPPTRDEAKRLSERAHGMDSEHPARSNVTIVLDDAEAPAEEERHAEAPVDPQSEEA